MSSHNILTQCAHYHDSGTGNPRSLYGIHYCTVTLACDIRNVYSCSVPSRNHRNKAQLVRQVQREQQVQQAQIQQAQQV